MRANFLQYTWKSYTGYCYAYVMITNQMSLKEIGDTDKELVMIGGAPSNYSARCVLEKCGLDITYVCDLLYPGNADSSIMNVRDYRDLLKKPEEFFFVVFIEDEYLMKEAVKMLQHHGVGDFGIIFGGYTKDFNGNKLLQDAFFESINEAFGGIEFVNQWGEMENIRRASLEGAGYWDVLYLQIYERYKELSGTRYLEVGPGIGVMSMSLKKLIDLNVTWLCIPDEEKQWNEWRRNSFKELLDKYHIEIKEGYIELESFQGEYDAIVIAQVMEHLIFNPVNTFVKLRNLLSEDGYLYVSVPEEKRHFNVTHYSEMPFPDKMSKEEIARRTAINDFWHFHEYSFSEAMEVFEESGLECVEHRFTKPIHHFILRKA